MADQNRMPKDTKNLPPLFWIILACLVPVVLIMIFGPNSRTISPSGESMPAVVESGATARPTAP